MIHSVRFTGVLDTNVMYPVTIRDLLLWFAYYDLFTPKWSHHIFDEWYNVMILKGFTSEKAKQNIAKVNDAFPDALVSNYEGLIDMLKLPDIKDKHVMAAAIKTNANVIVTNNLKDFPNTYLASFGLTAKSADDFLTDIIDLNSDLAVQAFKELVLNRTNPDMDEFQVLESFRNNGLLETANYLHSQL
jgi:predicted nucleic acid-binding protein